MIEGRIKIRKNLRYNAIRLGLLHARPRSMLPALTVVGRPIAFAPARIITPATALAHFSFNLLRRCWLLRFLGLPATIGTLLLRFVMRVRFLVVVAALPTEKEQNLLRVAGTHTDSFRSWRVVVKRIALDIHAG
jgi:hypothetical protein